MNKTQRMKAAIASAKTQAEKEKKAREVVEQIMPLVPIIAENGIQLKPEEKPKKKWWGDQRLPMEKADEGRLPHETGFAAQYDAEKKRWVGYMVLPCGQNFQDESGAVMKLLKKLDAQYRAWIKLNEVMPL